LTGIPKNS